MSQNPIKSTSTREDGNMFKPNIALSIHGGNLGPSSSTGYFSTLTPTSTFKYAVCESGDPIKSFQFETDSELISFVNDLGAGASDIDDAYNYLSTTNNYMLTTNINVTGSTDILPFAVWNSYSTYSSTEKWYNTLGILNREGSKQHALCEWIAMRDSNGTRYAAPYTGTRIWEINGTAVTEIVTATSEPSYGTISITQNRRYVANKPIHLMDSGDQEKIIPSSYFGLEYATYFSRYNPGYLYIYPLEDNTVVKIYRRDSSVSDPNWTWDKPTTTITMTNKFEVYEHTFDASLDDDTWNYIFSGKPVAITQTGNNSGDKTYAPRAANIIYRRNNHHETNMNGATSGFTQTDYVAYTPNFEYKTATIAIADGSGGDSQSGVGSEMVNKNYTFGNLLSDFHIISGHSTNTIKISSYNSTSGWTLHETITITGGTETDPVFVCRDGTQGFGNPCSTVSGGADNFNTDQLWLWEGTETFLCTINDNNNDEEALLGWDDGEVKAVFL